MTDFRRGRGQRQRKHWHGIIGSSIALTGAGTSIGGTFVAPDGEPYTVLRMFGEYTIMNGAGTSALDAVAITVAVGVFSADAIALGATAMPDPNAEPEYPWLYWMQHELFFGGGGTDPASESSSLRHGFDVGTMRKVAPRQGLAWVIEYIDITGTPPIRVSLGQARFLVGQ